MRTLRPTAGSAAEVPTKQRAALPVEKRALLQRRKGLRLPYAARELAQLGRAAETGGDKMNKNKFKTALQQALGRPLPVGFMTDEIRPYKPKGKITGYDLVAVKLMLRAAEENKSLEQLLRALGENPETPDPVTIIDDMPKADGNQRE